MINIEDFTARFDGLGLIQINKSLASYTYWKIGGTARIVFLPYKIDALVAAVAYAKDANIVLKVIGKGSNILINDTDFEGLVINLSKIEDLFIQQSANRFILGAGLALQPLSRKLAKMGLTGHEFFSNIPGSIGGATYMNAGTPKGEMKDIIIQAQVLTDSGDIKWMSNEELQFMYRSSMLKKNPNYIVLAVDVYLPNEEIPGTSLEIVKQEKEIRKAKQPLEYPNCGSVFRNPEGTFAGSVIESLGLKGYRIGDAQVSPKHANFIVNLGKAKAQDVKKIIEHIQAEAKAKQQIDLITEVEFWNF